MSRDKQIEEITEHLVNIQHDFDDYCAKPCRECELGGVFNCESYYRATELYDKGYRKASEVAREIIAIIDRRIALNAKRVQGLDLYGKGLVRARDAGYKDIKEIIQQKYIGEDKNVTTNTESEDTE